MRYLEILAHKSYNIGMKVLALVLIFFGCGKDYKHNKKKDLSESYCHVKEWTHDDTRCFDTN